MSKKFNRAIGLGGEVAKPGSTTVVQVLEFDINDMVLKASGVTVPSAEAGYAVGAEFIKTNGTAGLIRYVNEGTTSSCIFNQVRTIGSATLIAGGSALTLTQAAHAGKVIALDTAAGTTITLPAATGSGAMYRFLVTVLATSNSHIVKVANVSDAMQGSIFTMSDDPVTVKGFFAVAGTSDTVTLNRSTTGSVTKGEMIEIQDIATNVFQVNGFTSSTGTEATPFSATV